MRDASDELRTEGIFLPADGDVTAFDGGLRILTPSNPSYWWGNCLRFDHAPDEGAFERWMRLCERLVHAVQPTSTHRAFGWDGDVRGVVEPFVGAGFDYFETLGLAADRGDTVRAVHPAGDAPVVVEGDAWDELIALHVETRDPKHSADGYETFIRRRVDGWRSLEARGQGRWYCIRRDGRIAAALGVFGEAVRGVDGRRVGRFQFVVTHPSARRQGLAGTLIETASRYAFETLGVDTLWIVADENDVARRVYEACGYRIRSRQRGLERGW